MKIRAGFVTNSSSFSSVNLTITCKPLVDIINKYKKILKLDEQELKHLKTLTKGDKFYYKEEADGVIVPGRNKQDFMTYVIKEILHFLENHEAYLSEKDQKKNKKLYKPLVDEIQANRDAIIEGTTAVKYDLSHYFYGADMPYHRKEFAEIHPDLDYDNHFIRTYSSWFDYSAKGGKIIEEFDHDFEVEPFFGDDD